MNQEQKATRFAELHVKGSPLVLYNAWDAGSAKAIVEAGAKSVATSSWAIAEAHGYRDGESIPLALAEQIVARIVQTVDLPVTMDFEGGYSDDDGQLAKNLSRVLAHGIVGINFEDRVVKGKGLYSIDRQAARIAALRAAADSAGLRLFINARTDLFLGQPGDPADSVDEAVQRAKAYASAGASGFFIPGPQDLRRLSLAGERACVARRLAEQAARRVGRCPHQPRIWGVHRCDESRRRASDRSVCLMASVQQVR